MINKTLDTGSPRDAGQFYQKATHNGWPYPIDGIVEIDGNNKGLVHEIEDWMGEVQVNDMETGLQAFVDNQGNETYEQGFSVYELTSNRARTNVIRLNVPDSKDLRFKRTKKELKIWYKGRIDHSSASRLASERVGNSDISSLLDNGWIGEWNLSSDLVKVLEWY